MIVEGVRGFARFGRKLRPEDTGGRQTRDQAKSSLESVVREAAEWLRGVPNRHTKLARAPITFGPFWCGRAARSTTCYSLSSKTSGRGRKRSVKMPGTGGT